MAYNLKSSIAILIFNLSIIFMQCSLCLAQGGDLAPGLATWYGPPDGPGSGNKHTSNNYLQWNQ